jgi:hypothetical protein
MAGIIKSTPQTPAPKMNLRTIMQISAGQTGSVAGVFALCFDGTVWFATLTSTTWQQINATIPTT